MTDWVPMVLAPMILLMMLRPAYRAVKCWVAMLLPTLPPVLALLLLLLVPQDLPPDSVELPLVLGPVQMLAEVLMASVAWLVLLT